MTFLDMYHNLSAHSFYKSKIYEEIGINSLLVFNIDGIPFLARDYSDNSATTSRDYIFISAFISSILKYIDVEGKSYITDFGIGTSRYYLKFDHNNTVYCLILNELLHRRVTGEQLIIFVELTTNDLKKNFNTYYVDSRGQLSKQKFNEQFCLQIDKIFIRNFEQTLAEVYKQDNIFYKGITTNFKLSIDSIKEESGISNKLFRYGIKGLLICSGGGDKPVLLRNYDTEYEESAESAYFFCGLSNLLNKFALTNFGFFTDVGFGYKRVIFKFKTENKITLCLILSEILFRRLTGEILTIFSELTLKGIHKSIKTELPNLKELSFADENSLEVKDLETRLDSILYENATYAINEL